MPKLPKKKTRVLAEKKAYGETLGKLKAEEHFAKTKKGKIRAIKEILTKMLEKIEPVETVAVVGLTIIIKNIIVEFFEDKIVEYTTGKIPFTPMVFMRAVYPKQFEIAEEEMKKAFDKPNVEFYEWLFSFSIAFIIVRHGGALFSMLGQGATSLSSIVGLFFAGA